MAESESRIALGASIISEEQSPKRQTPNAKRQTPNAKRQTTNPEIARLSQTVCNDRSEPFSVLLHWSLLV
jgi:hypothetical protein